MEPWDGPAAIVFTDGDVIGGILDRNGLRPARYWVTTDGLVVLASEVGVLDVAPERIARKGRLSPGRIFLADIRAGRIVEDAEIKASLAAERPYRRWVDDHLVAIGDLPGRQMAVPDHETLIHEQRLFGVTEEDLRLILAPMATTGVEPVGSMGSDTPVAPVSDRPRLLFMINRLNACDNCSKIRSDNPCSGRRGMGRRHPPRRRAGLDRRRRTEWVGAYMNAVGKMDGVFVPISTPFGNDEEVDYDALKFNLERYASSGVLGHLALGSNGENRSLTEEEKLRVLATIVNHKGAGQVVMACATYDAQRDTERFLKQAAGLGADFGLVLSPGYFRKQMTDDVLFRYFSTLADTSPIPLLIYNAPGFCGVTVSPALASRLAAHPGIVGMKDSASSGIERFLEFESDSFHVLAGSANFLFPAMMNGAIGGTVSLANSFPGIVMELFRYGQARDRAQGAPLQERVARINQAISGPYGPSGVKAAMNLGGFKGGIPRRPLLPLTAAQVEDMRKVLIEEGILP